MKQLESMSTGTKVVWIFCILSIFFFGLSVNNHYLKRAKAVGKWQAGGPAIKIHKTIILVIDQDGTYHQNYDNNESGTWSYFDNEVTLTRKGMVDGVGFRFSRDYDQLYQNVPDGTLYNRVKP